MKRISKFNSTEIFEDWKKNKMAEVVKRKQSENASLAKSDNSRYYTNKRVKYKIDKLLEERNSLWAGFEHQLERYTNNKRKTEAEKENRRILKEIGAINQQIKQADEKFYREIEIDDNF